MSYTVSITYLDDKVTNIIIPKDSKDRFMECVMNKQTFVANHLNEFWVNSDQIRYVWIYDSSPQEEGESVPTVPKEPNKENQPNENPQFLSRVK